MAVVIETTLGDITVDLYLNQRPVTCLNFLKLCKMKYYNFNLFHSIRSGFIAQTGDPTAEGTGGESIWGILEGPQKRFFSGEKMPKIRHTGAGLLSMVCADDMMVGSQFFFTLAPDLDSLDGTHCVIGEVTEGQEVLTKLNEVICDETHRPYRDVRITHTVVLEDPFSDPPGLRAPSRSPSPSAERLKGGRIAPDEEIDETEGKSAAEIQELIDEKEAKARATILEIVGDLPDADIAPPENVLFVCKLNPVTTDDDLEIIFSRFGKIVSCEVIRDKTSGNSLQYAFIEFDDKKSCEDAYFKMDNVLIDDRRIHVDFSQSVSKMRWLGKGRGVQYFNESERETRNKGKDRKRDNDNEKNSIENKYRKREHSSNNKKQQSRDENDKSEKDKERRHDKDRSSKTIHRRSKSRSRHNSRDKVRNGDNRKRNESHGYDKNHHRKNSSSQNRQTSRSSPLRSEKEKCSSSKYKDEKRHNDKSHYSDKDDNNYLKKHKSHEDSARNKHEKRKTSNDRMENKKRKGSDNYIEPQTPSPVTDRKKSAKLKNLKEKETSSNKNEKVVKKITMKRKRKASSSSSNSDSSESSSSSSESSSSSNTETKKRKVKRKKRKESTSSSSSSDSSGSSTSSSTTSSSSETSSSSSDSEPRKNKSKKRLNKKVKKSKNK